MRHRFQWRNGENSHHKHFDRIKMHEVATIAEDILRFIAESNLPEFPINTLQNLCMNPKKLGRILDFLQTEHFIHISDHIITLTESGKASAEEILKKHKAIEQTFQAQFNNISAHKIAHVLEHQLSQKEINDLFAFSQTQGVVSYPLSTFQLPMARIHSVKIENEQMLYKLLSLGLYPGQQIEIQVQNLTNSIVRVKNSRLVLDRMISDKITVIPI